MQGSVSRRVRAIGAAAVAAALALTLAGCAGDSSIDFVGPEQVEGALPEEVQTSLTDAVTHAMAASGSSGALVGVWVPWGGVWMTSIGTQGAGDDSRLDVSMPFRAADLTRLMTCDVLYALADRDVVKLDDPVTTYVSGVPDLSGVTLLDLCNGTGGIGSSEESVRSVWLGNPGRHWSTKELASYGLERARTTPHTVYRDSDAGYLLLGLALEKAGGMSASELIAEYVTEPLGLENTTLPGWQPAAPAEGTVLKGSYFPPAEGGGYDCTAPIDITTASASMGFTDSGVVSTIADLGRYLEAQGAQALRVKEKPERYSTPLPAYEGAPSWMQATGGGWIVGSLIGQHGWTPGYLTAGYTDPATGLTVVVVLNNSSAGSGISSALAWELAAIASKVPAAEGATAPEFGLPFTAEQFRDQITASAICPLPEANAPADDAAGEEAPADEEE